MNYDRDLLVHDSNRKSSSKNTVPRCTIPRTTWQKIKIESNKQLQAQQFNNSCLNHCLQLAISTSIREDVKYSSAKVGRFSRGSRATYVGSTEPGAQSPHPQVEIQALRMTRIVGLMILLLESLSRL